MQQTQGFCNRSNPLLIWDLDEQKQSSSEISLQQTINEQEQSQQQNLNEIQEFIQGYNILESQQQQTQEMISKLNYENYLILDHPHQILSVSISKNGKYLAFGGYHNILVIYDLYKKEVYHQDRLQECMLVSKFSNDSKLLYLGCQKGQLVCYNLESKSFQKQRMTPKQSIQNLVLKDNFTVIFTIDSSIFIFDMKNECLLNKINQESKKIYGLDYDIRRDIILTGSIDQKIMIYDRSSLDLILSQEQAHQDGILQLQIIKNDRILTKDNKQVLKQWRIDYENKNLILICEISDILNFNSIKNDCNLIIQKKNFLILDQKFNKILEIPHEKGEDVQERAIQQLKSMEYILILGQKQLQVLKKLEVHQLDTIYD